MKTTSHTLLLLSFMLIPAITFSQDEKEINRIFHPTDEFPADAVWINSDFPISNSQLNNKVLIVNFFALDCPACTEGLHILQKFTSQHVQTQLITVMQCDSNHIPTPAEFLPVLWELGIDHPVALVKDFSEFRVSKPVSLPAFSFYLDPGKPIITSSDVDDIMRILNGLEDQMHIPQTDFNLSSTRFDSNVRLNEFAEPLLKFPRYLDANGNGVQLFISDGGHNRILLADSDGEVNVCIGSAVRGFREGSFYEAAFNNPGGISYDEVSSRLYIADTENHCIRMADMKSKTVTTVVGNGLRPDTITDKVIDGVNDSFGLPIDVLFHEGTLYALSAYNNYMYAVVPSTGKSTVYAKFASVPLKGGNRSTVLRLSRSEVSDVFMVTMNNGSVYSIDNEGIITKISGEDPSDQSFRSCDLIDETYLFTEPDSNRIRLRGQNSGVMGDIVSGYKNGKGKKARLNHPTEAAVSAGGIYVADTYNNAIRIISTKKKKVMSFVLRPDEQMMRTGDANSVGEHVFLPEINAGDGTNDITITLEMGNLKLYSGGVNEAHSDGVSGVTVKDFNILEGEIELELDPSQSTGSIILEVYFSIEHPDQPGTWLLKSAFVTIPVELSGAGTNNHNLIYAPVFFGTAK